MRLISEMAAQADVISLFMGGWREEMREEKW